MAEKKLDRRRFLKHVCSVVVGLVVGGAAVYSLAPRVEEKTIEKTVTKTTPGPTVTQTMAETVTVTRTIPPETVTVKPPPTTITTTTTATTTTTTTTTTTKTVRTTVSVVRVGEKGVEEALERAINLLGGFKIQQGSKVLVKPNICWGRAGPPTTSDPTIVEAIVNIVNRQNPSKVWIADGTGEGNTIENFQKFGFSPVAARTGAELVDLNTGVMVDVTVPGGGTAFDTFKFNRIIVEADVLISVACMKTHNYAVVTLGMKNLIGLVPAHFPIGKYADRWGLHLRAQEIGDTYLGGVICDLNKAKRISLTIIDGRIGCERFRAEPPYGDPVKLDLLIVGTDPVATDTVAATIMGFNPEKVPSTKLGQQEGIGTNNLQEIEVKGEKIEDVRHPFKCTEGHEYFQA